MESKGVPRHGGPVGVMLIEHEQGRARVKEMAAVSEEIANGNTAAAVRWVPAARGYSDLLRAHIQKENNVLFVMAERILSDDEQAELSRGFEKVEIDKMGPGTHERLHALMDRLVAEILA
jgi:hemerythrin-like domain-containing protein